jgi:hypothetical protein
MAMAFRLGQMEQDTKDIGKTIKLMEGESSGMLMEMFLKVNGLMIRLMAMEYMFI